MENHFTQQELHEIKKIKRINYIAFGIVVLLVAAAIGWWVNFQYWHSFTQEKWLDYPEKRVNMTADLFRDYDLIGMTRENVLGLLGETDYGEKRKLVYYLGSRRSLIDSEWLIVHLQDDIVKEYSIMTN